MSAQTLLEMWPLSSKSIDEGDALRVGVSLGVGKKVFSGLSEQELW